MNNFIDYILRIIETTSSRLNSWSWQKRWKNREEGYPLKRMDLSELPIYLKKNFNTFNEWFDT